jgi:hypothetical protein
MIDTSSSEDGSLPHHFLCVSQEHLIKLIVCVILLQLFISCDMPCIDPPKGERFLNRRTKRRTKKGATLYKVTPFYSYDLSPYLNAYEKTCK